MYNSSYWFSKPRYVIFVVCGDYSSSLKPWFKQLLYMKYEPASYHYWCMHAIMKCCLQISTNINLKKTPPLSFHIIRWKPAFISILLHWWMKFSSQWIRPVFLCVSPSKAVCHISYLDHILLKQGMRKALEFNSTTVVHYGHRICCHATFLVIAGMPFADQDLTLGGQKTFEAS